MGVKQILAENQKLGIEIEAGTDQSGTGHYSWGFTEENTWRSPTPKLTALLK